MAGECLFFIATQSPISHRTRLEKWINHTNLNSQDAIHETCGSFFLLKQFSFGQNRFFVVRVESFVSQCYGSNVSVWTNIIVKTFY